MIELWKKRKFDIQLLTLMLITLGSWFINFDSFIYSFTVYLLIYFYFMEKEKPVSHILVISFFSIMSINDNIIFKNEYVLTTILFFYVLLMNIKKGYIAIGKLLIPLLIYLAYQIISLSWTPVILDGFQGIIDVLLGYMVYFIITNGNFKIKREDLIPISKIATYIMLTLTIEIFYVYYQNGFDVVINQKNLVNVGWGYSNFIAIIFVLLMPIALYKYIDSKDKFLIYFILDILNIFGILLTLSRGAILGFVITIILFIIFLIRKRFIIYYGPVLIVISLIFLSSSKLAYIIKLLSQKYFTIDFTNDNGRFPLYKLAYERFITNPIFGDGIKSSHYMIKTVIGAKSVHYHNFILQIAATLGLIGLILFTIVVMMWLKVLIKSNDKYIVCSLIAVIGGLTHQMVDVSFDLLYFGLIFYTIIGIVEVYRNLQNDDELEIKIIKTKN